MQGMSSQAAMQAQASVPGAQVPAASSRMQQFSRPPAKPISAWTPAMLQVYDCCQASMAARKALNTSCL